MTNITLRPQTGRPGNAARCILAAGLALAAPLRTAPAAAAPPVPLTFVGTIPRGDDLSAIESVGPFFVVASDEDAELRVLEPTDVPNTYLVRPEAIRLEPRKGEVDIEAMARAGEWLYVLGSHSLKRPLVDPARDRSQNRERLTEVSDEPLRQRLYRLRLSERTGALVGAPESISLRPLLERDAIVGPFTRIPAGENGVNLEGLAADEDGLGLYLGFRSPVLREGFVPVMRTGWREEPAGGLLLLDLGGRGIRSLERVEGGFLVLATAERESGPAESIYFWDGRDQLPGAKGKPGIAERLLDLAPPEGGTTEGLCVTVDAPDRLEVVVVHDGVAGGYPLRLSLPRVHSAR